MAMSLGVASAQSLAKATFSPATLVGGASTTCTIKLSAPAGPSGFVVTISNSHSYIQTPASETVPAGSSSVSFTVPTLVTASTQSGTVYFKNGSASISAVLTVKGLTLASVKINPYEVSGGSSTTGTVRLSGTAPDAGFKVTIANDKSYITIPASVTVPAGQQELSFPIGTKAVNSLSSATITFTGGSVTAKASLIVTNNIEVLTQRYDKYRTGANTAERTLNTSNVNGSQFGALFKLPVDGQVYAQPLIATNVNLGTKGIHNVLYVCSSNNTVYAFDADSGNTTPYLKANFGTPISNMDVAANDINPSIGIVSTPVIDKTAEVLYVVTHTKSGSSYFIKLHALNMTTLAEMPGSPVAVTASVTGLGDGGSTVTLNPFYHMNRPALLLDHGRLYLGIGSHGDQQPYHGWVLAYDPASLRLLATFCATPDGRQGGIWQSGGGLAADDAGNIYCTTGNGSYTPDLTGHSVGNSIVKLAYDGSHGTLTVQDFFTPYNSAAMNSLDQDLGCTGPLLIPGSTSLVCGDKNGMVYVANTSNMGKFDLLTDNVMQRIGMSATAIRSGFVYWKAPDIPSVYLWSGHDTVKRLKFDGTKVGTTAVTASAVTCPDGEGGALALSSNGSTAGTGILWANDCGGYSPKPGVLYAFDAVTLQELWDSNMVASRDSLANGAKFLPPVVANGKVYMGTFGSSTDGSNCYVIVYGLLPK